MEKKNNGLIIFLVLIIVGLVGAVLYMSGIFDKKDNDNNQENQPSQNENINNETDKVEEKEPIKVTVELESELRKLIPTIQYCKTYLFKQYNGDIFYSSDLTEEDKTSNFAQCQGALYAYTVNYKNESTESEVYLYDYVLLYDQQGTDCDFPTSCSYGKDYKNINMPYNYVEHTSAGVSELSIKNRGQLYKYTFRLVNGNYEYVSTQAVK